MAKLLTQKEVEDRIKNMYNGEYTLVSKYTRKKDPITLQHKCGHIYEIKRAQYFLESNGSKCPICYKPKTHTTKRLTEEIFIQRVFDSVKDEYTYISGFTNSNGKLLMKHNTCGNVYQTSPHYFLGIRQRRCPICANKKRGKYALKENYLQSLLDDKEYGNEFIWLDEYKGRNSVKHRIKHLKCGHEYETKPNWFQSGSYCPYCSRNSSKSEVLLYEFIKENYNGEIIRNYRENNKNEIDIYIPDLKLGFEMNGYYWHSDKFKDKKFHLDKKEYYLNKGINIVYIYDNDWTNKNKIWKNKILYLLHSTKSERIYARDCKVKFNLSKDKKKIFLNRFHLQGNCADKFNLYLTYNKKIVAVMTFGSNRKSLNNNNERLELIRYATSSNFIVIGGFSRLLSHAKEYIKENYDYKEIWTFADRDFSIGNVYEKNGFVLDHISKPSYFYIYKDKRYNRYSFRKSVLKEKFPDEYDESLTEFEITNKIKKMYRVWNCGNLVYKTDV